MKIIIVRLLGDKSHVACSGRGLDGIMDIERNTDGWFYSKKFNHYQKVNKNVYCYVSRLIYGYMVQLYFRGETGYCELEARTADRGLEGLEKMLKLGDEWLGKYGDSSREEVWKDFFHVFNAEGAWADSKKKAYWI